MNGQPERPLFAGEILSYYDRDNEAGRLFRGTGRLEFARTLELLLRFLPPAPAVIYDVGGGAGPYACRLAGLGYEVHLLDPVPLHIERARRASEDQPEYPVTSFTVGDARALPWPDGSADAVLLLGPLYHLTEREDRLTALREAARVLKPGGVLFAAAITRFGSLLDGLRHGFLADPTFSLLVDRDLIDGQHRNPTGEPGYFTTSFFHHPDELRGEIVDAGYSGTEVFAIEGIGWLLSDFDERWEKDREMILRAVRSVEKEPSLIGASAHLLGVARNEAGP